jgi:hypothetical protein
MITDVVISRHTGISYEPCSVEAAPVLSLLAIDGWACSRVRFSLRKSKHVRKGERMRGQRPQQRKSLPHGQNGSPSATPTSGPRATPRRGARPLEGRDWPRYVGSRLAGAGTRAPTAGVSFLKGRSATAGQRPRRLGSCRTTLPGRQGRAWCVLARLERGRSVGPGTTRPARTLPRRFRLGGTDVIPRGALEEPIKTRRHPLGVVATLVVVVVVVVGGFFLRLPPLPGFGSTHLQCLAVEIFLLLPLFRGVLGRLRLLGGLASFVAIDLVLLYWRPRGPDINPTLPKLR